MHSPSELLTIIDYIGCIATAFKLMAYAASYQHLHTTTRTSNMPFHSSATKAKQRFMAMEKCWFSSELDIMRLKDQYL